MSKSNLRKQISKQLIKNFDRTSAKTVGQAARILLQSSEVQQCIVLKNNETKAIQLGFEAAIGRVLTKKEGTDYRAALKRYIKDKSRPFPASKNAQTKFFIALVKQQKLTFGRNIFYLPISFQSIKDNIDSFNKDYYVNTLGGTKETYDRDKFGETTHLDHGADGTASGLVGAIAGAFSVKQKSKKKNLPANFKKVFGDNLTYVMDNSLNSLTRGQKGKVYKQIMKLVTLSEQIISQGGDLTAGISMILTPVLAEFNIKRGSTEEKEIQEAFLQAFEMTFRGVDYADLEGSSSLNQKVEKLIILDTFVKQLKNTSNVSISVDTKNVKLSTRTKVQDKTKKGKGITPNKINRGGAKARTPKRTKASKNGPSMFAIMAMINKKLPQTLEKNMVSPKLNYQSGRLAQSVKLTDVLETARGFPSFGYTYQKSPYQTFEVGYQQGDPQRDPRRLIDSSIREIAAEMALGRFFTRRL